MENANTIDPETIGQMVAEGLAIIIEHTDGDEFELREWLIGDAKRGQALRPLKKLAESAHDFLDDLSILNDTSKQLRVSVAYNALAGLLSCYDIAV